MEGIEWPDLLAWAHRFEQTGGPASAAAHRSLLVAERTKLAATTHETTPYHVDMLPDGFTDPLSGQTLPRYTADQLRASYAAWSARFKIQALARQGCD
jgi:hypothetical protein